MAAAPGKKFNAVNRIYTKTGDTVRSFDRLLMNLSPSTGITVYPYEPFTPPNFARAESSSHQTLYDVTLALANHYHRLLEEDLQGYTGRTDLTELPRNDPTSREMHRFLAIDAIVGAALKELYQMRNYTNPEYKPIAEERRLDFLGKIGEDPLNLDVVQHIIQEGSYNQIRSASGILTINRDTKILRKAIDFIFKTFEVELQD